MSLPLSHLCFAPDLSSDNHGSRFIPNFARGQYISPPRYPVTTTAPQPTPPQLLPRPSPSGRRQRRAAAGQSGGIFVRNWRSGRLQPGYAYAPGWSAGLIENGISTAKNRSTDTLAGEGGRDSDDESAHSASPMQSKLRLSPRPRLRDGRDPLKKGGRAKDARDLASWPEVNVYDPRDNFKKLRWVDEVERKRVDGVRRADFAEVVSKLVTGGHGKLEGTGDNRLRKHDTIEQDANQRFFAASGSDQTRKGGNLAEVDSESPVDESTPAVWERLGNAFKIKRFSIVRPEYEMRT